VKQIHSRFTLGSLNIRYILDTETRIMGLQILPSRFEEEIPEHRDDLSLVPENHFFGEWGDFPSAWDVEPLVLVSISGSERAEGFSQGQTMRNGSRARLLQFRKQEEEKKNGITLIRTTMISSENLKGSYT